MPMADEKEIVIDVTGVDDLKPLAREAARLGIARALRRSGGEGGSVSFVSLEDGTEEERVSWVRVAGASDLQKALGAASRERQLVVECVDWKVIPLENLVAEFQRLGKRLYASVSSVSDASLALSVLERGVDGVVVPHSLLSQLSSLKGRGGGGGVFPLSRARLTRIEDVGLGDRACVDTATQLSPGEGMLVGSISSFFFLVHGETIQTEYIPARPFRVNAGALHSYTFVDSERTSYLSELNGGSRVSLVDQLGRSRQAVVGRVKIERRPLVLVEASSGDMKGGVMLQKAETIRLVRSDFTPVSVTELKEGDEVLVHLSWHGGRHFGGKVEEYVIER